MIETNFGIEKAVKPQLENAAGLTDESPEESFYFVFVCKGNRAAYKQIEDFIKARTTARAIFQQLSKNHLSVLEVQMKPVRVEKTVVNNVFQIQR